MRTVKFKDIYALGAGQRLHVIWGNCMGIQSKSLTGGETVSRKARLMVRQNKIKTNRGASTIEKEGRPHD